MAQDFSVLESLIQTLIDNDSAAQADRIALRGELAKLTESNVGLTAQVASLQTTVDAGNAQITDLTNQVALLTAQVATLTTGNVTEAQLLQALADLSKANATIVTLQTAATDADALVAAWVAKETAIVQAQVDADVVSNTPPPVA